MKLPYIYITIFSNICERLNKRKMKFLLQLPCCSCFCFIKKKKGKSKDKEPKEHWKSCFTRPWGWKDWAQDLRHPFFCFSDKTYSSSLSFHSSFSRAKCNLNGKSSCNDKSDFKSFNWSSCLYLHLWVPSLFPPFDVQRKQTQSLLKT